VAMLVPQRRGDLEEFSTIKTDLAANPELFEGYRTWITSRQEFLEAQRSGDLEAIKKKYQKHYFQGKTNGGAFFEGHQKKRALTGFEVVPQTSTSRPAGHAASPPRHHLKARPSCPATGDDSGPSALR
jgi:hypothetical protein